MAPDGAIARKVEGRSRGSAEQSLGKFAGIEISRFDAHWKWAAD